MRVKLTLWTILLCMLVGIVLAGYGTIMIYTHSERTQQLEDYRYIINDQKIKAELKTLSEMVRQKRHKDYEAIEQPILNEIVG